MMSFAERRALLVLKRTTNRSQSQRLTTLYWPQVTPMQESSSRAPQLPAQLASPSTNGTLFLVRTKMVSFKQRALADSSSSTATSTLTPPSVTELCFYLLIIFKKVLLRTDKLAFLKALL
ncbi:hypothetical protein M8J77_009664 [Diaphorina citri]|nr:hypothetical protein M8J77_004854 [Diaphorina citri]KAI5699195.1 hypothetical protein M8J77_004265 [Diaphorina citri]KAI5699199.1 hypothetical protein M8J77_009664 [Diaphorina citri]